ncbi:hypothetical protein C0R00_10740 [Streptomyces albidoflavus]|nr:hypothetical protein C0R00_10740 [Streptomyces albidoflavus]
MRAVRQEGIIPAAHSVLAVVFQRNLNQPETWPVGVSTCLALTFSTLLSSQGTDASFVLTLSGFPPGASLRYFAFPTLSDSFASDFLGAFPVPAPRFRFAFPFPAIPTLSEEFRRFDRRSVLVNRWLLRADA